MVFKAVTEICSVLSEFTCSLTMVLVFYSERSRSTFLAFSSWSLTSSPLCSIVDIRRSEELSLLKPPDDPSKKKKKREKNSPQDDIWDIWDLLNRGQGGTGAVNFLTRLKMEASPHISSSFGAS